MGLGAEHGLVVGVKGFVDLVNIVIAVNDEVFDDDIRFLATR